MSPRRGCSVRSRRRSTSAAAPRSKLAENLKQKCIRQDITTTTPGTSQLTTPPGKRGDHCSPKAGCENQHNAVSCFQTCLFHGSCLQAAHLVHVPGNRGRCPDDSPKAGIFVNKFISFEGPGNIGMSGSVQTSSPYPKETQLKGS